MAVLDASCPRSLCLAQRVSSRAIFFGALLAITSLFATEGIAQAPSAPTNFTATAGDNQVILSWDAPSGTVTGYEYKVGSAGWTSTNNGTNTTYTHTTGLINGLLAEFQIRAVNGSTKGTATDAVFVTPKIPAPTALTATAGNGEVQLSWTKPSLNPPSGADEVTRYEYTTDDGTTWTSTGGTDTSYTVTGLTNGQSYTFKVRVVRFWNDGVDDITENGLASDPSDPVTPNAPPQTPPPPPPPPVDINAGTTETLTVQRVNRRTVTLSWDIPTALNAQTIAYEYSTNAGQTWTSTNSTNTSITITGDGFGDLPPTQFRIRAMNQNADGTQSFVIISASATQRQRRIIQECPVGWIRSDGFAGRNRRALLYEVKLEMELHNPISIYKPVWVAIYVHPDEGLEHLDGWKLQVALPYNRHSEYLLTAENSVIVDAGFVEGGFAFIENPQETPFPMTGMGFPGSPAPGFDYRLYDETGRRVDFGISCYKRFDVFQVLRNTEDPRVLRKVLLESFDWDSHYLRSEWTVATPAPAAPALVKKSVVGTWGDLKKQ